MCKYTPTCPLTRTQTRVCCTPGWAHVLYETGPSAWKVRLCQGEALCVCVCVCVWWSFSPAIPKDIWWNRFLQGRGVCMCVRPNTWRNGGPAVVDQYEGGLSTPLAQSKIQHTFHSIPSWPQPVLGDKHPCSALFLKENSPLRACNEWLSTPPRTWWSTWSTPVMMTSLRRLIPTPPWAVALIRVRLSREGRGQTHTTISAVHAMTEPFPWRNIPKVEPRSTIPRQLMGTSAIHILGIIHHFYSFHCEQTDFSVQPKITL